MGKHAVSSTSKGKSSGSKPPASSLKSAVLSSEARKKKMMARSRPRTPPRSRPNKKVPTERSHRSKPANRSSIRRRSKPAARRPPTPPSPPSVSPTVEEEQEALRLVPKRVPRMAPSRAFSDGPQLPQARNPRGCGGNDGQNHTWMPEALGNCCLSTGTTAWSRKGGSGKNCRCQRRRLQHFDRGCLPLSSSLPVGSTVGRTGTCV